MARQGQLRDGETLADRATDEIRTWIIDGRLRPGDPLVETQLAEQFGVSRVPIREALGRLREQGFVEARSGHSATVAHRSARDLIEMLTVRGVLEGLACRLAASRHEPEDIAELREVTERGREAAERQDWPETGRMNAAFHGLIARASGNQHLRELIETYRYRLAWLNTTGVQHWGHLDHWGTHADVIEAIEAGDPDRAEEAGRSHVANTKDAFTRAFIDGELDL